jgi:ABC-type antimicrobial peptide transport system permease subunit
VPGSPYFLAWGVDPFGYAIRHYAITEGERLKLPREMLLGKVAAKNLKKKIGDTVSISGNTFRVVGIYETGVGYEDGSGVISLQEAQRIFKKPNQVSMFYVKLRDPGQIDVVKQQIETRFPQVSVSKSTEFAEKTNDMRTFRSMADALSFVSILIGGVGIMNAMLMSVFERTREIGTLRALGWRRRRVVGMILREAVVLGGLSGVAGIIFGVALGTLVSYEPTMGVFLKGSYSLTLLAQAIVVALVLGVIGALYPAWRAANLSPIEALRYE